MKNLAFIELIAFLVFSATVALSQSQSPASPPESVATAPRRVKVNAVTASTLIVQKAPLKYPDAAMKAGIQGTVVLDVVTNYSGDVQDVTVVSGDPVLSEAAIEAVKQWKYKPYLTEGSPAEMEMQVNINFQVKPRPEPAAPPLGKFLENGYSNDYFDILYPLSRDWVGETELIRSKLATEGNAQGIYVLLAELHIPQDTDSPRADASFTVFAASRPGGASFEECRQYLEGIAREVQSQKEGKQKGEVTQFTVASHDFYRVDFEYRHGVDHRTFLCTAIKDYLLQWTIIGWSKQAVETAVSTLSSITSLPPTMPSEPVPARLAENKSPRKVRISSGVSTGMIIKKVTPTYPPEARQSRIQGSVVMKALISRTGDIVDLELISGPPELAVSAVNAVRQWKYHPYLLKGEPVSVDTQIVVNYALQY